MSMHFTDRLLAACAAKGAPVCVGLDPVYEKLPAELKSLPPVEAIEKFSMGILEASAKHVPCVKPQAACYERYGAEGYAVYHRVTKAALDLGLIVVGDAKRGDIGTSSAHYAAGLLAGPGGCDALTVNGYLGADGIEPFFDVAQKEGKGLFALVRTSNPGGDAIQKLRLADGRSIADAVGDMVAELGRKSVGESGYSLLGAVVGATKKEDAAALRARLPQQLFLVPGFGAQGGGADDVRACFQTDKHGKKTGAIITASRSVIFAFEGKGGDWKSHVEAGAKDLKAQIAAILA
jgi:orotidine-5'-phosphate decarboxylase